MTNGKQLALAIAGGGSEESKARREDGDFFPTTAECLYALLDAEPWLKLPGLSIWEPHCGEGHIAIPLSQLGHAVHATELKDRGFGLTGVNFLKAKRAPVDGIVMNPPFAGAQWHIRRALSFGYEFVISLLPAEFWNRDKHLKLWREYQPSRIYQVAWKPDFTGGGSGIFCVQWNVWRRGFEGATTITPLERPRGDLGTSSLFGLQS